MKHNKLHHTFTNIVGHDDDIDLGVLGATGARSNRGTGSIGTSNIYLWFLYTLVAIKWHFVDDFRDVIRGRIGNHPIERPKGLDLLAFIFGKLIFLTFAFVIPCLLHRFVPVLLWYLFTMGITGLVMSAVFQLAHVVEPAAYPLPDLKTGDMDDAWAIHQMQTTVDFAQKSKILTWFLGGLNYQAEHHLLANVSHLHYPRISRLVANACKRYGCLTMCTRRCGMGWLRMRGSCGRWAGRRWRNERWGRGSCLSGVGCLHNIRCGYFS